MASKLVEKIGDMTDCSICSQKFRRPKHLLPCLHIFCQVCIEEWATRKIRNNFFPCPLCKCNVRMLPQGVQAFPGSFLATKLMDNLESSTKSVVPCDIHPDMTIFLYCKDCDVGICNECLQFHPKHLLNSINTQRQGIEEEIKRKINEGEEKKRKIQEIMIATQEVSDQNLAIVNKFFSIMNGVIDKINAVATSVEHQRIADERIKELQDLTNQCGNDPGFEDSFPVYLSRKEVLKKLDEANRTHSDMISAHVPVQVKMKDDVDVEHLFNHCFTVENVQRGDVQL